MLWIFQEPAGPFVPLDSPTAQLHPGATDGRPLSTAGLSAEDRFGEYAIGRRSNTSPG
jgi:hypothetical protein